MADAGANPPAPPRRLIKQQTWSPQSEWEEAWLRRKDLHQDRRETSRLRRSITDEDINELCACIDLGFGFELDRDGDAASAASGRRRSRRLSETFPALDLYYAVNRSFRDSVAGSSTTSSSGGGAFFSPHESPKETKARLRRWAQVVACSLRHHR